MNDTSAALVDKRGVSLVELMVASVVVVLIMFSVLKVTRGLWEMWSVSRRETEASALGETIVSKIRGMDFYQVYSVDPDNKNPDYVVTPATRSASGFDPNNYLLKWDVSPSSPTLYAIESDVKARGFEKFTIQVSYMVRNTVGFWNANHNSAQSVPWKDLLPGEGGSLLSYSQLDGCSDVEPTLCFRDLSEDGQYYGGPKLSAPAVYIPPQDEVPATGLKQVTVKVFGKKNRVYSEKRVYLMAGNLNTDKPLDSKSSDLEFNVSEPGAFLSLFAVTLALQPYLELPIYRSVPGRYFSGQLSAWRMDKTGLDVRLNDSVEGGPNRILNLSGSYMGHNFHFAIGTQPSGTVAAWVCPFIPDGTAPNPWQSGGDPDFLFSIKDRLAANDYGDAVYVNRPDPGIEALMNRMDNQGVYELVLQKRTPQGNSGFRRAILYRDLTPPRLNYACHRGYGPAPFVQVEIEDDMTNMSDNKVRGVLDRLTAFIVQPEENADLNFSTVAWKGKGGDYTLKEMIGPPLVASWQHRQSGYDGGPLRVFRLVDTEDLPSFLGQGRHKVVVQFGDFAGYKSSHSWIVDVPDYTSDDTVPDLSIDTVMDPTLHGAKTVLLTPAGVTAVNSHDTVDFRSVTMQDPDSGIQCKSVRVEHYREIGGVFDDLQTLLSESVRPGALKMGAYFIFYPDQDIVRLSEKATAQFSAYAGQARTVRFSITNWNDKTFTRDLKIQVN